MCYDVSLKHRIAKREAEKKLIQLREQDPNGYLYSEEGRKLLNEISVADWHIRDYEKKIASGIKF